MTSERTPLLSSSKSKTVKFYVGDEALSCPEVSQEPERRQSCLLRPSSWGGPGQSAQRREEEGESDAEFLASPASQRRASRTLPNNAPAPFVWLGLCCAVIAGLCFTSSNVMVKYIPDVNSWQLLCVRCLSQMAAMVPIMVVGRHHILGTPDTPTRLRVAAQGVLGGFLLLGIFEAVARMPLGDCTAIFFSAPAFTMVLSCFILRDHCGVWRIIVAGFLLTGVVILARPESLFQSGHLEANYDIVGLLSALSVPCLSALIVILTRQAKHVHYSVLVFWFGMGGLVVSLIGMFGIDDKPIFREWDHRMCILSIMVALVGIVGSIMMNLAVCWVTPSKVMVVRSFEVVAAYILQVTVFDVPTHWTDLIGTVSVISAVIAMGFEDCVMERVNWRWM